MLQLGMMMMMMMMMDAANLQVPVTAGGAEVTSFIQQVLLASVVAIQQLFGSFATLEGETNSCLPRLLQKSFAITSEQIEGEKIPPTRRRSLCFLRAENRVM